MAEENWDLKLNERFSFYHCYTDNGCKKMLGKVIV